jgi:hypothetical protein
MTHALVEMGNASLATRMKGATAPFMHYVVHPSIHSGRIYRGREGFYPEISRSRFGRMELDEKHGMAIFLELSRELSCTLSKRQPMVSPCAPMLC